MEWLLIPLFIAAAVFCGLWRHEHGEAACSQREVLGLRRSFWDASTKADSLSVQNERLSADNARQAKRIEELTSERTRLDAELESLKAKPAKTRKRTSARSRASR